MPSVQREHFDPQADERAERDREARETVCFLVVFALFAIAVFSPLIFN
jgi:hypothetical protein